MRATSEAFGSDSNALNLDRFISDPKQRIIFDKLYESGQVSFDTALELSRVILAMGKLASLSLPEIIGKLSILASGIPSFTSVEGTDPTADNSPTIAEQAFAELFCLSVDQVKAVLQKRIPKSAPRATNDTRFAVVKLIDGVAFDVILAGADRRIVVTLMKARGLRLLTLEEVRRRLSADLTVPTIINGVAVDSIENAN